MNLHSSSNFQEAQSLSMSVDGSAIDMPRISTLQTARANTPAQGPEEYYKRTVFIPFLDYFITQLTDRFSTHRNIICGLQKLIPGRLMESDTDSIEHLACVSLYKDLLPSPDTVNAELKTWKAKWDKQTNCPLSAVDALTHACSDFFPNIRCLLVILATLPVSTASSERSFSTLRRLKSYLRSSMNENRLTGLALMSIHRSIPIDVQEVINIFARVERRKDFVL